jgi:hypothetical protein
MVATRQADRLDWDELAWALKEGITHAPLIEVFYRTINSPVPGA